MFVPIFGEPAELATAKMKGTTLVISSNGVGQASSMALDFTILNDKPTKLGYLKSSLLEPLVHNDMLTPLNGQLGQITMPVELWLTADCTKTLMVSRTMATDLRKFADELVPFVKECGFSGVALLTSTFSAAKRERHFNQEIPEVFAYCNNFLYKQGYYKSAGVRKFGNWIEKRLKPHPELKALCRSGWA